MRERWVLLLVFVVVLAEWNCANALGLSKSETKEPAQARRLLRSDGDGDGDAEARAGISGLAEPAKKVGTSIQNLVDKLWLKSQATPATVFKSLRLGKAQVKFDNNQQLLRWLNYVKMYRTKNGNNGFNDADLFNLLKKTNSDESLATLFHSLRQVSGWKNSADTMQIILSQRSSAADDVLTKVWLSSRTNPEEVFQIFSLQRASLVNNPEFLQWVRYSEKYKATMGGSYSDLAALNILLKERSNTGLATALQFLKGTSDLKTPAENMQTLLFQKWAQSESGKPENIANLMGVMNKITGLSKRGPEYGMLRAYSLYFAKLKSGESTMKKVKELFARNKPIDALKAAASTP